MTSIEQSAKASSKYSETVGSGRRRVSAFTITLAVNLLSVAALLFFALSEENSARVRNSLIASVENKSAFSWTPADAPDIFRSPEQRIPVGFKASAIAALQDDRSEYEGEFSRALALARHLVANKSEAGGIRSGDTLYTYEGIQDGKGYCADYTRVFTALALANNLAVRAWGFGFDGFGSGHAFNEVYDEVLEKWVLIDSFYSLFILDSSTQEPVSVLELQSILRDGRSSQLQAVPINPDKFAFRSSERAISYYEKGSDQLFLSWGHNAFNYEENSAARFLAKMPRPIEVTGSIIAGLRPDIKILKTTTNDHHIDKLVFTKWLFLALVVFVAVSTALLLIQFRHRLRRPPSRN